MCYIICIYGLYLHKFVILIHYETIWRPTTNYGFILKKSKHKMILIKEKKFFLKCILIKFFEVVKWKYLSSISEKLGVLVKCIKVLSCFVILVDGIFLTINFNLKGCVKSKKRCVNKITLSKIMVNSIFTKLKKNE